MAKSKRARYPSDRDNRSNEERGNPRVSFTIPRELFEELEALELENKSAWIADAIEQKLRKRQ